MKRRPISSDRRHELGAAAVELALVLPILAGLLALALFIGRVFLHYTVAQKAAHDAARFMSTIPVRDMTDSGRARIDDAVAVAQQILDAELAELDPGSYTIDTVIRCGNFTSCNGLRVPATVSVGVEMRMNDTFFPALTYAVTGDRIIITANVTMPYAGK
ncbi:TadE/TadG family type IV pilus assembly protein [Massilia cavernae]|uniref:Pilus assembly protein n=1 Tax=Massilia cavernae TaxID=2320864 RepID=A0A418XGP0_9BURK|nr:TadE family protein [Massilia cavernae]RJG11605.1 pilus assembly protein [Massilia cavernae]